MPWWEKDGITLGMGMTEKQGGTDVRANTTAATPGADGYSITGHKWFMSAPMCDAFLVLAQAPGGLTCFLMPRFRPDGAVNALRFQRLKDKLGNSSNASSEVEFVDAFAWRVGEEGRGVRTIIEMVHLTRLDCAISSAGHDAHGARAGAAPRAPSHGVPAKLADQPMMRTLLADMALEVEGAIALMMRLCRSFDRAATTPSEAACARLLTPAVKFWSARARRLHLRGDGVPGRQRLRRGDDAGAALSRGAGQRDLGRLRQRHVPRRAARAVARRRGGARGAGRIGEACAGLPGAKEAAGFIGKTLMAPDGEAKARAAVERLALLAAAAALAEGAPAAAEAFARTRLATPRGGTFGTADLAAGEVAILLDRALPAA